MKHSGTSRHALRTVIAAALMLVAAAEAVPSRAGGLGGESDAPWTAQIRRMDEALSKGNTSAAEQAWHDAYVAALRSLGWEGMVEVGDAVLRVGEAAKSRGVSEARARGAYWTALFRARQERSLEGVLRAAEAFAALGDQEVAAQCARIAEGLAAQAQDARARARVQALRQRLAVRVLEF